jgi:hypothetical protein
MEREPFTKADLYYLEHQDAYELQKAWMKTEVLFPLHTCRNPTRTRNTGESTTRRIEGKPLDNHESDKKEWKQLMATLRMNLWPYMTWVPHTCKPSF